MKFEHCWLYVSSIPYIVTVGIVNDAYDKGGCSSCFLILIIYKKLKQLTPFLTKIRSTVPLTGGPLIRPKGLTKGWGRLVSSMFSTKSLILFTPAISCTHLLYPCITFLWHTLYFPLHMHSPIIRLIICFRRIIIDIIVYRRKERCVLFLEGK